MTRYLTTAALVPALLIGAAANAHDPSHDEFDQWYGSLRRPNVQGNAWGTSSCCSRTDCATTEAELRNGEWWARLITRHGEDVDLHDWVKVPPLVILDNVPNPTGSPVICNSTSWRDNKFDPASITVYCFIRPSES